MRRTSSASLLGAVSFLILTITGCTMQQESLTLLPTAISGLRGSIHGGQQPVGGSTIQLYAVSTTSLAGAATPLLTVPVSSDSNGNFSITGTYTCPSSTSLVYITATGGNPGLSGTVNNTSIAEMTALGTCGSLTSSTFIQINELTTVVAVEILAPYMTDLSHVGADASTLAALSAAFSSVGLTIDSASGQLLPTPAGVSGSAALYNTLANILASCINSTGAQGSNTLCGKLFTYTSAGSSVPTETITAMLHIVQLPNQNVALLFSLSIAFAPFQPTLPLAPTTFIVAAGVSLPVLPYAPAQAFMTIDSNDQVWIYLPSQNPYTLVDNGILQVYGNDGSLRHTITAGAGGLSETLGLASDHFGNVWALNHNHTLSKFSSSGTALSPTAGYPTDAYVTTVAGGTAGFRTLITVDPSGNVWLPSLITCFSKYSTAGVNITPAGGYCTGSNYGGAAPSEAVTSDRAGGVYLSVGTVVGTMVGSILVHLDSNGNQIGSALSGAGFNLFTAALEYDPGYSQIWGFSQGTSSNSIVSAIKSDGTAITPSTGLLLRNSLGTIAIDGGGRLWVTLAAGISGPSSLNEIDHNGTPLLSNTGLHPTSFQEAPLTTAIDSFGNIWVVSTTAVQTFVLTKIEGFAIGKQYQ